MEPIVLKSQSIHGEELNGWINCKPSLASFGCISPLSAKDPMHPNLTVSSLSVQLQILPP